MVDTISIVDISRIGLLVDSPSAEDYSTVGKELDTAFENIGFVYLAGHGVGTGASVEEAMAASRKFFLQDEDKKESLTRIDQQGWVAQGREVFDQAENGEKAITEIRESFDINRLDPQARFPDSTVPEFRKTFTPLAKTTIGLADRLLRALSTVLGKNLDYFTKNHRRILEGDNASALRALYYPPVLGPVLPGHVRCGEHSDYGTFTLLFQDDFPGLEVKSARGAWVEAKPIPDTILVNIGDLLEIWTAGRYPATLHRVVIPDEEIKRKATRQSIVFFIHPDDEVVVSPLDGPCSEFPPITALQHVENRFAQTYQY